MRHDDLRPDARAVPQAAVQRAAQGAARGRAGGTAEGTSGGTTRRRPGLMGRGVHPVVWGFVLVLVAVELVLKLGDAGVIPALRPLAYGLFAVGAIPPAAAIAVPGAWPWFLAGLVGHAFLHVGWLHLTLNAIGLLCLGHVVQTQSGTAAFLAISFATAVAGAVFFLVLADHATMIGASGVVFGLLGAVLRQRRKPIALWRVLLVLALLSLPADLIFDAAVAWQAHLGGFLAGWVLGRVFPVRRRIIHPLM